MGKERADLLIKRAEWIVTMDEERRIIRDGAIAVKGDTILDIDKTEVLERRYEAAEVIDAQDRVIIPGMIDSHVHSAFQMSRGLADEVGEQKFLFERMYPYEGCMDDEDTYWSALLCTLELLKHGVTCFIDPGNYHIDQTAKAVEESGMRCIVAKSSFDIGKSSFGAIPEAWIETTDEALERAEAVIDKWHGKADGRIKAFASFRGLNNCTDRLIQGLKEIADRHNTGIQTHCAFAQKTRDTSLDKFGMTEVERLEKLGVLGPNVLLGHVGWLTPAELMLMQKRKVCAVACPSSSFHNGYGNITMGHIPELLEMGLSVGVGSDHASSGIVDLLQELRIVGMGFKETRIDPKIMPPERVFEMATVNGAKGALWDKEIGSLEAGKMADIVMFDTMRPEWMPLYNNPLVNLVYSATGSSVDTVIVAGNILVAKGEAVSIDEGKVYGEVKRLSGKILKKTGLEEIIMPKWKVV
ncbi:MAG: amidohydrolase [Deltaproteobacteria bacterium]|nr:amidohydrolase [Deltaproteobacteria bacterium]